MKKQNHRFPEQVQQKEKRKVDARQEPKKVWFGMGMFGVVGWSVALPTVAGGFIGLWIDARYPSRYSWTLMLILLGLVFGCFSAWSWIRREGHHAHEKEGRGERNG